MLMTNLLTDRIQRLYPAEPGAQIVVGSSTVFLLGTFLSFLLGSSLAAVFGGGLLLSVGVGWFTYQSEIARWITIVATIGTVLVLALIVTFIVQEALPAFAAMGPSLLVRTSEPLWGGDTFSLAPMIWGTVTTTILATIIAAPLGIGGALFLSEIAPESVRSIAKPGIELLAGIPSITYGFIGMVIINQYFTTELDTPTIGNYFTVGLMIGLMALPTIVTVAEDAISTVPESMKSGSLAVGATDWQTMKSVTIPAALSGVSAAVLLGVGRAMGETMAATVMIPHTKGFPSPLYDVFGGTGETLTTVIAFEGGNAQGLHLSALFAAGVVLFLTVLTLSVGAQLIERRMEQTLGGSR